MIERQSHISFTWSRRRRGKTTFKVGSERKRLRWSEQISSSFHGLLL